MLSVANKFDLPLFQLGIRTAFLYGELPVPVLFEIPDGLDLDKSKYALELRKALYGLKTAARLWFEKLTFVLNNLRIQNSIPDQCIYFLKSTRAFIILIIYVDILIAGRPELKVLELIELLSGQFRLNVIQKPHTFLGIEINRQKDKKTNFSSSKKLHQATSSKI